MRACVNRKNIILMSVGEGGGGGRRGGGRGADKETKPAAAEAKPLPEVPQNSGMSVDT